MKEMSLEDKELVNRVRTIIGVPEVFLPEDTITSPVYIDKATKYINSYLKEIESDIESEEIQDLVDLAYVYYICSQLCISMPLRLPIRMENISTKTLLQSIDWEKFADEMMARCNEILDDVLEESNISQTVGYTVVELSDETTYPNSYM